MVHFGCATLEIIVLEEGLASYRLFCINAVSLEQATHIRPVLSVAVSAPQWGVEQLQWRPYDVLSPSYLLSDSLQRNVATFAVGNGRSFGVPGV